MDTLVGGCAHHISKSERDEAYQIFFGTLVSPTRLHILHLLREADKNVSELIEALGIEQTIISHHLSRLKKCGFVTVVPQGKYRYYRLNKKTILPLLKIIENHMAQYCVHLIRKKRTIRR